MKRDLSKLLFYALAAVLLIWTSRLTISLVNALLPNMIFAGVFALILFDVGTIAWLFIFLNGAEGNGQRITSILMCLFDLVGIGLVSFVEIYLDGQSILTVPEYVPTIALYVVVVSTVANITAVVLFHLFDPEARKSIKIQNQKDKIRNSALKILDSKMAEVAGGLSEDMAEAFRAELLEELKMPKAENGQKEPDFLSSKKSRIGGGK